MSGRHASDGSGSFYRDLAMMILGIILVGGAVFFILYLIADEPTSGSTTTEAVTSTTLAATTTSTDGDATTTSTTTPATTTSTIPVRPPDEVRVVVLNSVGIAGAAGRMTERLEGGGYKTLQAADLDPEQDPSRIWYREGFSAEANELLTFIPDAKVEPLPDEELQPGADIVMVLGTGYEE